MVSRGNAGRNRPEREERRMERGFKNKGWRGKKMGVIKNRIKRGWGVKRLSAAEKERGIWKMI